MAKPPGTNSGTEAEALDLSTRLMRVSRMLDEAVAVLNETLEEIKGKDGPRDERPGTPNGE